MHITSALCTPIPHKRFHMHKQQKQIAGNRENLQMLNDVLHAAGEKPVLDEGEMPHFRLQKSYKNTNDTFLVGGKRQFQLETRARQLPKWIPIEQRRAVMAMLRGAAHLAGAPLPLRIGQQMTINLTNRMASRTNPSRDVELILRSVPVMWGKPRFDNVKVAILGEDGVTQRLYFGKCLAFLQDAAGNNFVVLHWYENVGRVTVNPIAGIVHLRLADKLLLKSYDALPVGAIRNGALLVPGVSDTAQPTGEFWALESTREHAERPHFHARAHTALPVPNASQ